MHGYFWQKYIKLLRLAIVTILGGLYFDNFVRYYKNLDDSTIADGQMSHTYDDETKAMAEEYPVVTKLPIKNSEFSIYYSDCGEGSCEIVIESEQGLFDKALQYFSRSSGTVL